MYTNYGVLIFIPEIFPLDRSLTWGFVLGAVLGLAVGIDESAYPVVRVAVASFREASLSIYM